MPTSALVRKLLRDLRLMLAGVALILAAFQCLWTEVTARVIGHLAPLLGGLGRLGGLNFRELTDELFRGEGQVVRALIGGEGIELDNAMDLLSVGYIHPLIQTLFCIWAVGRASGAIAGEIDRGTMELLLAQPLARWRLVLAHFLVDVLTIPVLCLSLWAGSWLGGWIQGFAIRPEDRPLHLPRPDYLIELGPLKVRVANPLPAGPPPAADLASSERLRLRPAAFGPALPVVGGFIFAVCGSTMALSAAGRFRWRVLGVAVFVFFLQFLVNLVGQLWPPAGWLRPLTIFYYYQPQQVVLGGSWDVSLREWNAGRPLCAVPMLAVLYGVGLAGYAMALRTLARRDLPAPL
jgi:ABC-2 type transport system permease protein